MTAEDIVKFNEAVSLANAGQKQNAYLAIKFLLLSNYDDVNLLLWLAFTTDDIEEAKVAIDYAARIKPNDASVEAAYKWLEEKTGIPNDSLNAQEAAIPKENFIEPGFTPTANNIKASQVKSSHLEVPSIIAPVTFTITEENGEYSYFMKNGKNLVSCEPEFVAKVIQNKFLIEHFWKYLFRGCTGFFVLVFIIVFVGNNKDNSNVGLFGVISMITTLSIAVISMLLYAVSPSFKLVKVYYDNLEKRENYYQVLKTFVSFAQNSSSIWNMNTLTTYAAPKYNAGTSNLISKRYLDWGISLKKRFVKCNKEFLYVRLDKRSKLFLFEDRFLYLNDVKIITAPYTNLGLDFSPYRFIETRFFVPKDVEVVDYTWKYVNKNGSPDRRFRNNQRLPILNYASLTFSTQNNFEIATIISSNFQETQRLYEALQKLISET